MTDDLLDQLQRKIWAAPPGREQISLLEEAIQVADSRNEEAWAMNWRLELVDAANSAGMPEKSIVAFTWCLSKVDAQDGQDPLDDDWTDLIWPYKEILEIIPVFDSVSRQQIIAMQDDFATRLLRDGDSGRTAEYFRSWNFMRMGDYAKACEHEKNYKSLEQTDTSDCEACELDRQVELRSRMHEDKQALKLATRILSGRMVCGEVPGFTSAHLVRSMLRLGKLDEAIALQKKIYPTIRHEGKYLGTIGDQMLALIHARNFRSAIQRIESHLPQALESKASELKFRFFSPTALCFEAMAAENPKPRKLRLPKKWDAYREDDLYDPQALADYFAARAQELATRFDARNGNDLYHQLLEENRSLAAM